MDQIFYVILIHLKIHATNDKLHVYHQILPIIQIDLNLNYLQKNVKHLQHHLQQHQYLVMCIHLVVQHVFTFNNTTSKIIFCISSLFFLLLKLNLFFKLFLLFILSQSSTSPHVCKKSLNSKFSEPLFDLLLQHNIFLIIITKYFLLLYNVIDLYYTMYYMLTIYLLLKIVNVN